MEKPARCPVCNVSFAEDAEACFNPPQECPYRATLYPELCSLHDHLYFGKWRLMTASVFDIKRAHERLQRFILMVKKSAWEENLQPAKLNVKKAFDAIEIADINGDPFSSVRFMDQALSYSHHAINDLLHERGEKPHRPADYENFYDIILPFKEDW